MKKGALEWEQLAKLIIIILLAVVLFVLIITFKEKIFSLLEKLKEAVRFR